jgi:hypothetical protein
LVNAVHTPAAIGAEVIEGALGHGAALGASLDPTLEMLLLDREERNVLSVGKAGEELEITGRAS